MKQIFSYKKSIISFLGLLFAAMAWAQPVHETKTIQKVFGIDPTARIEISNKYGNIHINTWDKDSVKINIDYTIKAKDQKRYDKAKQSLDFEIIETSHYIIAKTIFKSAGKEIFRDLSSAISNSSNSSITVNYELFVPANSRLNITNKYGDVYTEELGGDVTFDLGYGMFKAHNFTGHADLTLNNCQATINNITVGIISMSYGNLILTEAGSIKLNSRNSKAKINSIDAITIEGKSDEIDITHCEKVNLTGNFSKFSVGELSGTLNAQTKYGNLDIYLAKTFSGNLNINSKYTDIIVRLYPGSNNLQTEIRHQRSKIAYPTGIAKLKEEKISGNDVIYHSSGSIGNGKSNGSNLTLQMESGELNFYSR